MVRCEYCFALSEQPEHVGCELHVAVTRGEREDGQAGPGWGLEVAGLNLGGPYYARGVVLAFISDWTKA